MGTDYQNFCLNNTGGGSLDQTVSEDLTKFICRIVGVVKTKAEVLEEYTEKLRELQGIPTGAPSYEELYYQALKVNKPQKTYPKF